MSILKKRRNLKISSWGSDATEFVNRVKGQVRTRQKRMSNVAGEGEEHSIIWEMFMAVTMNAATFMGKNFQDNQNSIMNTTDLTLKKMFDISAPLVSEQDEIFKVDTILWENTHSKIATNDVPCCKGAIERIILDFSNPSEEKLWKSKSLECES